METEIQKRKLKGMGEPEETDLSSLTLMGPLTDTHTHTHWPGHDSVKPLTHGSRAAKLSRP